MDMQMLRLETREGDRTQLRELLACELDDLARAVRDLSGATAKLQTKRAVNVDRHGNVSRA